jgi:hypothetical protein
VQKLLGQQQLGGIRKRKKDNIKIKCKRISHEAVNWIELTQAHGQWQVLVCV